MKKLLIVICLFSGSLMVPSLGLIAQSTTTTTTTTSSPVSEATAIPLDAKTQKKVDNAKVDLAKGQKQLTKDTKSLDKITFKYNKDLLNGDLSPNEIKKQNAKIDKTTSKLEKLKAKIAKLEKYLIDFK